MIATPRKTSDAGFTLIEVMVTIFVLAVGLLSLLTLVDRANGTTKTTIQREAATNLARELVERANGVDYTNLTAAGTAEALRQAADPDDSRGSATASGSTWSIRSDRRGTTPAATTDLDVTVSSCSILAPSSRPRVVDSSVTLCRTAGGGGGGGNPPIVSVGSCSAEVNVDDEIGVTLRLLVSVDLCVGGSLAGLVCTALGPTGGLDRIVGENGLVPVLLGGLGGSFSADVCGGNPVVPVSSGTEPADSARRVTIEVEWGSGSGQSIRQTTIVPRPAT